MNISLTPPLYPIESDQAIDMEYATLVSETKIDENSINITDEDTEEIRGAKVCYTPTCVATGMLLYLVQICIYTYIYIYIYIYIYSYMIPETFVRRN